jgi:hypothetical protein
MFTRGHGVECRSYLERDHVFATVPPDFFQRCEIVRPAMVNPLLMIRAKKGSESEAEAVVKSIIVPLDVSAVAESILPVVAGLAKRLDGLTVSLTPL